MSGRRAALLAPDFWLLSLIRCRAEGMVWTPGRVMDYAEMLRRMLAAQPNSRSRRYFGAGENQPVIGHVTLNAAEFFTRKEYLTGEGKEQ